MNKSLRLNVAWMCALLLLSNIALADFTEHTEDGHDAGYTGDSPHETGRHSGEGHAPDGAQDHRNAHDHESDDAPSNGGGDRGDVDDHTPTEGGVEPAGRRTTETAATSPSPTTTKSTSTTAACGKQTTTTLKTKCVGGIDSECKAHGYDFGIAKFEWTGGGYSKEELRSPYQITVSGDNKQASWTAAPAVAGVLSKEGLDYKTYSGGASGTVRAGEHAISHITFCGKKTTTSSTTTSTTSSTTTSTKATTTTTGATTTTTRCCHCTTTTSTKPTTTTTHSTTTTTTAPTTTTSTTHPTTTTTTQSTTTTTLCTTTTTQPTTTTTTKCTTTTTRATTTSTIPSTTTSTSTTTSSTSSSTTTTTSAATTTTRPTHYKSECCDTAGPPVAGKVKESCFDGVLNCHDGSCEEEIDCGGPCGECTSCSDGVQNQGESGVDCGGPCTACKTTSTTQPTTTTAPGGIIRKPAGSNTSKNTASNVTETTAAALPEEPDITGGALSGAEGIGRSLLPLLLALLAGYYVYKKTRKRKTEDVAST